MSDQAIRGRKVDCLRCRQVGRIDRKIDRPAQDAPVARTQVEPHDAVDHVRCATDEDGKAIADLDIADAAKRQGDFSQDQARRIESRQAPGAVLHEAADEVAVCFEAIGADAEIPLGAAEFGGHRLQRIDADITNEDDLAQLADATQAVDALHLVINAAGVLHGGALAPEKTIEQASRSSFERVFALNAFAPLLLAKVLLPQLCRGQPAVFASLSARVGSIGDNRAGGWYAYRASKAAQNQLLKTFAIEWKRRNPHGTCLLLHPGTVDTPLSAPFQSKVPADRLFDPQRAATQLLQIIAGRGPADSGRFIAWDGQDIPW